MTFEGKYHRVTAAGILPMPIQRPIPLWIGGSAESAIKRAAQIADGFFPQQPLPGGWPTTFEKMRRWREEAGGDWAGYGIEARLNAASGTPDDWRKHAEEWRALGATHLTVNSMGAGLKGADAHVDRLKQTMDALRVLTS